MKTVRVNFTIPEDVVALLKGSVDDRRRSAFVSEAITDKVHQLQEEQLRRTLIEGYAARRDEDAKVNGEWERATLEGWG